MLEIILIYFLSKQIGIKAEDKGHRKGPYIFMFIILWFCGEIIGAIIGVRSTEELTAKVYLFALVGAALGTIISFVIVNSLKDLGIVTKKDACTVCDEKLIVYNKTHESLGILAELEIGSKFSINFKSDFPRFYEVRLADGKTGYILKTAKYS
ncbi:MAG: hypothetical protein NTZ85_02915 [Bacteroidia bacterium]|jgi:hypothetical protein|nr:hypothetical protein [Bacteroidia bacterium]